MRIRRISFKIGGVHTLLRAVIQASHIMGQLCQVMRMICALRMHALAV